MGVGLGGLGGKGGGKGDVSDSRFGVARLSRDFLRHVALAAHPFAVSGALGLARIVGLRGLNRLHGNGNSLRRGAGSRHATDQRR
jgi:hypothetical protein